MVDYKEILRLTSMGYSLRQTAASVGHSHHTVKNVLELAAKLNISCSGKRHFDSRKAPARNKESTSHLDHKLYLDSEP